MIENRCDTSVEEVIVHLYADDTQFHCSCKPADAADLAARASHGRYQLREDLDVTKSATTERR